MLSRFSRRAGARLPWLANFLAMPACAVDVSGSGSTFVHAAMMRWAADYFDRSGVAVSYDAIGSSGGIRQVEEGRATFGAADGPLLPTELVRRVESYWRPQNVK